MKKSLKHLPEGKQEELQKIVAAIQKSCKDVEIFQRWRITDFKLSPLIWKILIA